MITHQIWRVRGGRALGPAPFLIAGILNATPDSFSDGGKFYAQEDAIHQAEELSAAGAHILDIGGESTRPGAGEITQAEELARILPVLHHAVQLRDAACGALQKEVQQPIVRAVKKGVDETFPWAVSVDTWRVATAQAALEAGADIINDISAGVFDPAMAEVIADTKPGYVLMHGPYPPQTMQAQAEYTDVTGAVLEFFERRMAVLVKAGLPEDRIVLDPGIGFAKTLEHNLTLLRDVARLQRLGRPLYYGISRKSFLGGLLGLPVGERETATQVVTTLLASAGVFVHRVHDVRAAGHTLKLVEALQSA